MKIGILTGLWFIAEKASILESLERVSALGFRYVDLHGTFHASPSHLSGDERLAVKHAMERLCLEPRSYVLHPPHNIASSSEKELKACYEYIKEGIEVADLWGIRQLMLNAGQWVYGISRTVAWRRSVDFIQRLCDYAAPRGIYIAQEAEPYVWYLVNDTSSTLRMLEDVDRPNFTTLVDLGHMALAHEGPEELISLGDSIIHIHLTDHAPFQHTNQIVGTGITPICDYLEALSKTGIDRRVERFGYKELVVSLELGYPGDQIDSADEFARLSLENVQKIMPSLTQA